MKGLIFFFLAIASPLGAQDRPAAQGAIAVAGNPLAELKDEVKSVLARANLPFTDAQERAVILMMEDRRQASEDLFGTLMDFTAGPTQGQQNDSLRSAIEWMRTEFLNKLRDYLTPEQLTAWTRYRDITATTAAVRAAREEAAVPRQPQQAQTQYVRINNNAFTAEDGPYRFGQGGGGQPAPQVVDRGGAGAFHGNAQFLLKDESLNARNPFASNKPPYQERQAMPERASTTTSDDWNLEVVQFSNLSARSIFENRLNVITTHSETVPFSDALRINVLDTFNSGGAQNRTDSTGRDYNFSNLFTRLGEKVTIRAGMQGRYRNNRSFSESNFGGTFTFSTLDSYVAGQPLNYRVTRGEPSLRVDQLEASFFLQNDWKITPRLTLMAGTRYDVQDDMSDSNNIAPRLGFAYALGRATVIRGGGGVFFLRTDIVAFENQRRLDGQRQYELVIDNPSFPDPFQAGTIRNTPRSIRIMDPDIEAPYVNVAMASFERNLLTNLFVSASYDYQREYHRLRPRNVNAPFDATASAIRSCTPATPAAACIRPDPAMGNVVLMESSGNQLRHTLRLAMRQRFSIFNVTANYTLQGSSVEGQPNGGGDLPSDNYSLRLDYDGSRGLCCPPQTLNGAVNARLPLGVFLTSVVSMTSQMYNVTTGRDDNRDNTVNDRPAGVPRNSGNGPKVLNFNFNISKAFFFGPAANSNGRAAGGTRTNLNLFANMTNAFNRLQYGPPSGVMTSPNFGKSTSALAPRQIEVGMRFQF